MASGYKIEYQGDVAERTFRSLVVRWTGAQSTLIQPTPDRKEVDLEIELPSVEPTGIAFLPTISLHCQVKTTSRRLTISDRQFRGRTVSCVRLPLEKDYVVKLRKRAVNLRDRFYLILGIPEPTDESSILDDLPETERFEWLALDLCQYFEEFGDTSDIWMPRGNRLNFATFSLLWASQWVRSFYLPIAENPIILQSPQLGPAIESTRTGGTPLILADQLSKDKFLFDDLPKAAEHLNLNRDTRNRLELSLGVQVALSDIISKISQRDSLDELIVTCTTAAGAPPVVRAWPLKLRGGR